jgi:tetratricopeptide (TPR) repeat protein
VRQIVGAVLALALLSACEGAPFPGRTASKAPEGPDDYLIARSAVKDGNFSSAIASYERVLDAFPRGKSGAEVRLEFANVLLHANQPDRALDLANEVPKLSRDKGLRGRAAILASIAQHMEIEAYLETNPPYLQARDKARNVYFLMETVYEKNGKYDDDGIIPARIRILRESLAKLELRQVKSERAQGNKNVATQRARYILTEFSDTDTVNSNKQFLNTTAR